MQVEKYVGRVSGPLLDRIDLHIEVPAVPFQELSAQAERQYSRTITLHALRGPIVDRRGAQLATSSNAESLFAQPRGVGDPVRVECSSETVVLVPES